jgi:hypothetical protein
MEHGSGLPGSDVEWIRIALVFGSEDVELRSIRTPLKWAIVHICNPTLCSRQCCGEAEPLQVRALDIFEKRWVASVGLTSLLGLVG